MNWDWYKYNIYTEWSINSWGNGVNTTTQPFKFRIKTWVKINADTCGTYNTNSRKFSKFKCTMLKSNLYVYSCAYMLVKGNVTVGGQGPNVAAIEADRNN